jgi:hypothetical protein
VVKEKATKDGKVIKFDIFKSPLNNDLGNCCGQQQSNYGPIKRGSFGGRSSGSTGHRPGDRSGGYGNSFKNSRKRATVLSDRVRNYQESCRLF